MADVTDLGSIFDNFSQFLGDYGMPIYLGSQAASVMAKREADRKMRGELQRKADAERARQAQIGDQARGTFNNTLPMFQAPAVEDRRAKEQQRMETMAAAGTPQNQAAINYEANVSAPQVVKDSIAGRLAEATAKGKDYAKKGAISQSFGSAMNQGNIALGESAQTLGRLGHDAERSSSILPLEMQTTRLNTGRQLRTTADILGGAGNIAGLYSMTRRKPKVPDSGANRSYTFGGNGTDLSADWPAAV